MSQQDISRKPKMPHQERLCQEDIFCIFVSREMVCFLSNTDPMKHADGVIILRDKSLGHGTYLWDMGSKKMLIPHLVVDEKCLEESPNLQYWVRDGRWDIRTNVDPPQLWWHRL